MAVPVYSFRAFLRFFCIVLRKRGEERSMDASRTASGNDRLRQERIRRNWRQQDLADQLGTTVITVKRWERGRQQPGMYFRIKLCELFGKTTQELGLGELNPHTPHATEQDAPALALWTVPYGRNPQFTGRDDCFARLNQQFFPQETTHLALLRRVALTQPQALKGLGGVGKTQIAVEYAYRARDQGCFTHILWVNAASEETLLRSFVTLGELLPGACVHGETDQRKLVEMSKSWLDHCLQPWLLIFDNADEISLLPPYLPQRGNGSLLLTTRSHAVGSLATSIEVENMGLMEGTTFLLHRAQRQQAGEEEYNEAMSVVIALDGFPLALDQAGAYIEETGCSFSDYLQMYEQYHQALLARRGTQITHYPDSVATTWSLCFEKLAERNPAAVELLHLCAFLAPDSIAEQLLLEGACAWPAVLQQTMADRLRFQQAVEDLLRFSLVRRQAQARTLRIHRLVQIVQRDRMEPEEQRLWAERVVRSVHAIFPRNPREDPASWPQCLQYLDQAQTCDTLIRQYRLLLPEAAELLTRVGAYLCECALYTLAEALAQQAIQIWEQLVKADHLQGAAPLYVLAEIAHHQGRYAEAESMYQRACSIWEQHLGPADGQLATVFDNLAVLSYQQGKYQQAETFWERALQIWQQGPDVDYLHLSTSLNGLAILSADQGKYEQAESLFQHVLSIQEQTPGLDQRRIASTLHNLATLYTNQGKYRQAEPLFQHALCIREQTLGLDHPDMTLELNGLAELYAAQGTYQQAQHMYERALRIAEQALGPEHPHVVSSLSGLASLYCQQNQYEEATSLFQRALSIREDRLGLHHPQTAQSLCDLATCLHRHGHDADAAPLYQRALVIWEEVYGLQHSKTTEASEGLHAVLDALERTAEAEQHAERDGELSSVLPLCPRCQSNKAIVKSGTNRSGSLRFRCHCCQHYFTPHSAPRGYDRRVKAQAILLAEQGKGYRFIARQMGVNHRTIRSWIKAERVGEQPVGEF